MELFIYSGISELPSIDYDCLRVASYVKIFEIPVQIKTAGNPYLSPNGFLPYLRCTDGQLVESYEKIIEYFKEKGYMKVNEDDDFKSSAYICDLNNKLYPCFEYILWGDPANVDAMRTLYARRTPFPFNFVYPQKYMKLAEDFLETFANFNINDKVEFHKNTELLIKAKMFINLLSEKLDSNDWLFGQYPTEFDCSVYAALSILVNIPLQSNDLRSHINECPNLIKYLKRIRSRYLLDIKVETEPKSVMNNIKKMFMSKDNQSLSNTTTKVLAGLIAISSMAFYAYTHGMLEIGRDVGNEGYAYDAAYDDDDLGDDE